MEKKLKTGANIITLLILTAGLIHGICMFIADFGVNGLVAFAQFIFLIPYALSAAVVFGAGRLLLATLGKKEMSDEKKVKIAANVIAPTILVVGLVVCGCLYVSHLSCNGFCGNCEAHPLIELMWYGLFVLAAAAAFIVIRLLPVRLWYKDEGKKIKKKKIGGAVQSKLKIASNIVTLTILIVGFGFCLAFYIIHEVTCDGCSAHAAYLEIGLMFYGVIVLFAGVIFSISRLVLALLRNKVK